MPGSPWTDVKSIITSAGSFLRLAPITLSGTDTISAFGTAINFTSVTDEGTDTSMQTPKLDFVKKELTSGVNLEMPIQKIFLNALTGYEKSANDLGVDSFTVKILATKSLLNSLISAKGKPFAGMLSQGYDTQGTHLGYKHLIGYLDKIVENVKRDFLEISLNLKGGVTFLAGSSTFSDYNTAMTTATIEPVGKSVLTPKAITAGDYANLLSGVIVKTDAV